MLNPIDLANPAQIEQDKALKHADDKDDAFFLAEAAAAEDLPKAYVYDPQLRPVPRLVSAADRSGASAYQFAAQFCKSLHVGAGVGERVLCQASARGQENG